MNNLDVLAKKHCLWLMDYSTGSVLPFGRHPQYKDNNFVSIPQMSFQLTKGKRFWLGSQTPPLTET